MPDEDLPRHVVAYDFGVKSNILRMLVDRGCRLTVVPAQTSAADVLALNPDGIFLSNGPGDPASMDYAVETENSKMIDLLSRYGGYSAQSSIPPADVSFDVADIFEAALTGNLHALVHYHQLGASLKRLQLLCGIFFNQIV